MKSHPDPRKSHQDPGKSHQDRWNENYILIPTIFTNNTDHIVLSSIFKIYKFMPDLILEYF